MCQGRGPEKPTSRNRDIYPGHQHQQVQRTHDSLFRSLQFVAKDKLEHPLLKIIQQQAFK